MELHGARSSSPLETGAFLGWAFRLVVMLVSTQSSVDAGCLLFLRTRRKRDVMALSLGASRLRLALSWTTPQPDAVLVFLLPTRPGEEGGLYVSVAAVGVGCDAGLQIHVRTPYSVEVLLLKHVQCRVVDHKQLAVTSRAVRCCALVFFPQYRLFLHPANANPSILGSGVVGDMRGEGKATRAIL